MLTSRAYPPSAAIGLGLLGLSLLPTPTLAQQTTWPPLGCLQGDLTADQAAYRPSDPILLQLKLVNACSYTLAIPETASRSLHQLLTFVQNGQALTYPASPGGAEWGPPLQKRIGDTFCSAIPIELMAPGAERITVIDNAREVYKLTEFGPYRVQFGISVGHYSEYVEDPPESGRGFACLDSLQYLADPLLSNPVVFELQPDQPLIKQAITVTVNRDPGHSLPLRPQRRMAVALFKRDAIAQHPHCAAITPQDSPAYYACIWQYVKPVASTLTTGGGQVSFPAQPQGRYVAVAYYQRDVDLAGKAEFHGLAIESTDPAWTGSNALAKSLVINKPVANPPPPPPPACVTAASVNVTRGGFYYNRFTRIHQQSLTLTNTSGNILAGPIYLVLDNLSSNATLTNANGVTACATPAGGAYLQVSADAWNPNTSLTVTLKFTNSAPQAITYDTRVLYGAGKL